MADPTGVGTYIQVPRELNTRLGLKGRPKVQALIAGHPYRGSLMPMGVLKAIQLSAGVARGDTVTVQLELDTGPRVIEPPADLARLLAWDKKAAYGWEKLSYTNKREMARSLEDAKKPETRERRLAAALEKLRS
jgi:hypothetical protein